MRQLSADDIRFQIRRGLQQLPTSTLRDLAGAADKRERALELAADIFMARFDGHEFHGPDPIKAHGKVGV